MAKARDNDCNTLIEHSVNSNKTVRYVKAAGIDLGELSDLKHKINNKWP